MKITDDYSAKIKLWAANPKVHPLPPFKLAVTFSPQKFSSHAEMNEWKRKLILEHARALAKNGPLSVSLPFADWREAC